MSVLRSSIPEPLDAREQAALVGGRALVEHYADVPHQTFHHEPSVAAVVIDRLMLLPVLLRQLADVAEAEQSDETGPSPSAAARTKQDIFWNEMDDVGRS